MTMFRPMMSALLLVAVVFTGSGCASMQQQQGTVIPITQADLPSLAGVWNGWAYAGANGFPGELTLRQDGYFTNSVGAFTSSGTFQIQNGALVSKPYTSGGISVVAEQTITVQLIEKNGRRFLSGNGQGYSGGPYSFEYSRR